MPTDDPAPRVRQTATESPTQSGEFAPNGGGPPAVRPDPLPDDEADARIDEFFGSGPEPTAVPERRLERKTGPERPVGRGAKSARRTKPERPVERPVGPLEQGIVPVEALTAPEVAILATPGLRAQRASRRLRARRVRRLVRHVEPWSVLKLALVFYFCLWVIMLVSGAILWRVAVSSGVIDNIEGFIESLFVLDNFKFNGDELFRAYAVGGLLMVIVATGFTVLATVLFNLISDLIGGVRVTVIQEETARPNDPRP